jgi:WD40 repeat protein
MKGEMRVRIIRKIQDALLAALILLSTSLYAQVAIAPDEQTFAIADGTDLRIQNFNGTVVALLRHPTEINCLAYSPDGKTLASGGSDGALRIWNIDGSLLQTLEGHRSSLTHLRFNSNGNAILTASYRDHNVILWEGPQKFSLKARHTKERDFDCSYGDAPFSCYTALHFLSKDTYAVRIGRNRFFTFHRSGKLIAENDLSEYQDVAFTSDLKGFVTQLYDREKGTTQIALVRNSGKIVLKRFEKILHCDSGYGAPWPCLSQFSISPDDKMVAARIDQKVCYVWSFDGKLKLEVPVPDTDGEIVWFSDAKRIAMRMTNYSEQTKGPMKGGLLIIELSTGKTKVVVSQDARRFRQIAEVKGNDR